MRTIVVVGRAAGEAGRQSPVVALVLCHHGRDDAYRTLLRSSQDQPMIGTQLAGPLLIVWAPS
jgi:hypothetical protein